MKIAYITKDKLQETPYQPGTVYIIVETDELIEDRGSIRSKETDNVRESVDNRQFLFDDFSLEEAEQVNYEATRSKIVITKDSNEGYGAAIGTPTGIIPLNYQFIEQQDETTWITKYRLWRQRVKLYSTVVKEEEEEQEMWNINPPIITGININMATGDVSSITNTAGWELDKDNVDVGPNEILISSTVLIAAPLNIRNYNVTDITLKGDTPSKDIGLFREKHNLILFKAAEELPAEKPNNLLYDFRSNKWIELEGGSFNGWETKLIEPEEDEKLYALVIGLTSNIVPVIVEEDDWNDPIEVNLSIGIPTTYDLKSDPEVVFLNSDGNFVPDTISVWVDKHIAGEITNEFDGYLEITKFYTEIEEPDVDIIELPKQGQYIFTIDLSELEGDEKSLTRIRIRASKKEDISSFLDILTIPILSDSGGVVVNIPNSFAGIGASLNEEEEIVYDFSGTATSISVFEGDFQLQGVTETELSPSEFRVKSFSIVGNEKSTIELGNLEVDGKNLQYAEYHSITGEDPKSFKITFTIQIKRASGRIITLISIQNLYIGDIPAPGQDAVLLWLKPSAHILKRKSNGDIIPETLTLYRQKKVGSMFFESEFGTLQYKIQGDDWKPTGDQINISNLDLKGKDFIEVRWLDEDSAQLDIETIPILKEGNITVALSNQNHILGFNEDGELIASGSGTEIRMWNGLVQLDRDDFSVTRSFDNKIITIGEMIEDSPLFYTSPDITSWDDKTVKTTTINFKIEASIDDEPFETNIQQSLSLVRDGKTPIITKLTPPLVTIITEIDGQVVDGGSYASTTNTTISAYYGTEELTYNSNGDLSSNQYRITGVLGSSGLILHSDISSGNPGQSNFSALSGMTVDAGDIEYTIQIKVPEKTEIITRTEKQFFRRNRNRFGLVFDPEQSTLKFSELE